MAYFADNLTLKGTISLANEHTAIGICFLKPGFRTKGYYNKKETENIFELHVPYLIFNLSANDTNPKDKVLLFNEETSEQIGEYEIIAREPARNMKSSYTGKIDFNWYTTNAETETIDCSLFYTADEMDWIKTGISPSEMEDRVILYVDDDDNTINFYESWQGQGLYKAFFRQPAPVENSTPAISVPAAAGFEIYRLIAVKRPGRDTGRLLSDFVSQLEYHFDTLEFARGQQERIKLKRLEKK